MTLSPADLSLLGDFTKAADAAGWRYVLIGASARIVRMDETFALTGGRTTTDWDFAVELENWGQFDALREALTAREAFRPTSWQHRLEHRDGGWLDLVPFGAIAGPDRRLHWRDGSRMSVLGFDECARASDLVELRPGVRIQVGSIASLALLKLVAYLDRREQGITKDAQDLYWLLEHYTEAGNEARLFDEIADAIRAELVLYEDAGAWLLGVDIGTQHEPLTVGTVLAVLENLEGANARLVEDALARRAGRYTDDAAERAAAVRKLTALRNGIRSVRR